MIKLTQSLSHEVTQSLRFWLFIDDYVISFLLFNNSLSNIKILIYAYILCNFQCTILVSESLNPDNKITEDNLLIQDSFNNPMIVNVIDFIVLDLEMSDYICAHSNPLIT